MNRRETQSIGNVDLRNGQSKTFAGIDSCRGQSPNEFAQEPGDAAARVAAKHHNVLAEERFVP